MGGNRGLVNRRKQVTDNIKQRRKIEFQELNRSAEIGENDELFLTDQ